MTENEAKSLEVGDKILVARHSELWDKAGVWKGVRASCVGKVGTMRHLGINYAAEQYGLYMIFDIDNIKGIFLPIDVIDIINTYKEDKEIIL